MPQNPEGEVTVVSQGKYFSLSDPNEVFLNFISFHFISFHFISYTCTANNSNDDNSMQGLYLFYKSSILSHEYSLKKYFIAKNMPLS